MRRTSIVMALLLFAGVAFAGQAYTPKPGSAERKAILDAMRAEMSKNDPRPVVFVVSHLKVKDRWAWLQAAPQSPDGANRYESESALLRKQNGKWTVVDRMPAFGEREGTPLENDRDYYRHLQKKFAGVPSSIFP